MPRTTHSLQKVKAKGRIPYFRAKIGGRQVYLGTDRRAAKLKLAEVLTGQADAATDRPGSVSGLIRKYLVFNPKMPEWKTDAWSDFTDDGALPLSEVEPDHLSAFHKNLKAATYHRKIAGGKLGPPKKYSAQTIRHYLSAASMILTWAYEQGWIRAMPVRPKTAKPQHAPRDLPLETVQKLLDDLREPTRTIVRFIFSVGCRPSEACSLRWEWYRPRKGGCGSFVLPVESHKTGERVAFSKTLYLTTEGQEIVDRMPRGRPLVFVNAKGRPFTADGIQSATSRQGISKPYALRHTFATNALAQGTPLHLVGELLGHRNIATTQKYARVLNQSAAAAASALGPLLPMQSSVAPEPTTSVSVPVSPSQRRVRRSQG